MPRHESEVATSYFAAADRLTVRCGVALDEIRKSGYVGAVDVCFFPIPAPLRTGSELLASVVTVDDDEPTPNGSTRLRVDAKGQWTSVLEHFAKG